MESITFQGKVCQSQRARRQNGASDFARSFCLFSLVEQVCHKILVIDRLVQEGSGWIKLVSVNQVYLLRGFSFYLLSEHQELCIDTCKHAW